MLGADHEDTIAPANRRGPPRTLAMHISALFVERGDFLLHVFSQPFLLHAYLVAPASVLFRLFPSLSEVLEADFTFQATNGAALQSNRVQHEFLLFVSLGI